MPNFFETRSFRMEESLRINKSGTKNTACLKRGYTYGNNYISYMSMLETCAQNIIYLFCRDESCCFMRHKHLAFQCEYNDDETLASMLKEIMIFIMQSKLKNLLLLRVSMKLLSS